MIADAASWGSLTASAAGASRWAISPSSKAIPAVVASADLASEKHMSTRSGSPKAATSRPATQTTPVGPARSITSPSTCGHGSSASVVVSHALMSRGSGGSSASAAAVAARRRSASTAGTRAAQVALAADAAAIASAMSPTVTSASRCRYLIASSAASWARVDEPPTPSTATRTK